MHIVDGALSVPVLAGGAALAAAGVAVGLRRMDADRLPQVGVVSAAFFVASLVHVPVGPSNMHLILGGLAGVVLGWTAFPALFVALLLQAVFFGFGGVTVLGVNLLVIAGPAVLCAGLFGPGIRGRALNTAMVMGGLAGAGSIAMTALAVGLALALSGDAFIPAAKLAFIVHIPVMAVEGALTAAAVVLLRRVKPELLASAAVLFDQRVTHA